MKHQSFVDWMKALGMLLIVVGHIFGGTDYIFNTVSQPVYTKQLGVAFFVFITGWSLANETRHGLEVIYNKIFPVYFYGFSFAVLLSTIYFFIGHDINESNYLPFIGGINVFLNYFPANPTTWYIGTYLHLLIFWFYFIQGKTIGKQHIAGAFVIENAVRCLLLSWDQNMTAYMLLPNWLTVFLLGMYLHNKRDSTWSPKITLLFIIWVSALIFWSSSSNPPSFDSGFPFRKILLDSGWELPLRSFIISMAYVVNTLVVLEIARRLPELRLVSFFARNTLILFITHMPIIYAFHSYVYALFEIVWLKKLILIIILYFGISFVSEIIQKLINIKAIRGNVWSILQKALPNQSQSSFK